MKTMMTRRLTPRFFADQILAGTSAPVPDLPGICRTLAAARHLLEMYRRQLADTNTSRKLQRLDKRLLTIASELDQLIPPKK
jgi:hypothetical protein